MGESKRLGYVDVCKAIGIICVVLGHTYYASQTFYDLIYCFHMPFFFILSGYAYNKNKYEAMGFGAFLKDKVRKLLLPYFAFGLVNLALQYLWMTFWLHEKTGPEYIIEQIKGIVFCYSSMDYMPNCSPIWFLLCLFIASILFFWVLKLKRATALIIAVFCMGWSYFTGLRPHDYSSFPWKYPVFLMAVFLMYIGYLLRELEAGKDKRHENTVSIVCLIILVGAASLEIMTGNSVGMNENEYGNLIVFLLTAIPISTALILLCRNYSILGNCRPLIWLGRNTIYIVGFNYLCRDLAAEIYYLIPILRNREITFLPLLLLTAILCFLCIVLCRRVAAMFLK